MIKHCQYINSFVPVLSSCVCMYYIIYMFLSLSVVPSTSSLNVMLNFFFGRAWQDMVFVNLLFPYI